MHGSTGWWRSLPTNSSVAADAGVSPQHPPDPLGSRSGPRSRPALGWTSPRGRSLGRAGSVLRRARPAPGRSCRRRPGVLPCRDRQHGTEADRRVSPRAQRGSGATARLREMNRLEPGSVTGLSADCLLAGLFPVLRRTPGSPTRRGRSGAHFRPPSRRGRWRLMRPPLSGSRASHAYPALIFTSSSASEERPRLLRQQQTGALIRSLDSSARRDRTHVQPNPRR
jgi:hypothetical protein